MTDKKDSDKSKEPPVKRIHRPGVVYNPRPPHIQRPDPPGPSKKQSS